MVSLNDLLDYTDWERQEWHAWFAQQGVAALTITAGPHGDGRFGVVGDLVRHIFSAEKRYVERLSGRPLTDATSIPADNVEALFSFGQESRTGLREFIATFPAKNWDVPQEFAILNNLVRVTPRKIVIHVVLHEIRHWAQIATLLRLSGLKTAFHDFLGSPVLGGEFRRLEGNP
jgi:uncharacterized damage-inducible protein DinB